MNDKSLVPEWIRRKMSESHKGRKRSPSECASISRGLRGRKLSPEHCRRIKESALERYRNGWNPCVGKKRTPEQNAARSAMMMGRKVSESTKQKIRMARLGKKQSPEVIEKTRRAKIALNLKGPKSVAWRGGKDVTFHVNARKIWEEHTGAKIPPGYHIHHVDGNCRNNDPANLQLVSPLEHARLHPYKPGCRIYKRKYEVATA